MMPRPDKPGLHPRNRFRAGYDFPQLKACSPALAEFVAAHDLENDAIHLRNLDAVYARTPA